MLCVAFPPVEAPFFASGPCVRAARILTLQHLPSPGTTSRRNPWPTHFAIALSSHRTFASGASVRAKSGPWPLPPRCWTLSWVLSRVTPRRCSPSDRKTFRQVAWRNRRKGLSCSFLRFRLPAGDAFASRSCARCVRVAKGKEREPMTNFENMTATAQVARSRAATLVPSDASWIDIAPMGIELHCGWICAPGGV